MRTYACAHRTNQRLEGMEGMEKKQSMAALIRTAMPTVMRMVADKRRELGDAHVVECQRRGMAGEAGWFFAREGAVAVGTPWQDDPVIAQFVVGQLGPGQAFVCFRPVGVANA